MTNLFGKRILFVSPEFFGYDQAICDNIKNKGGYIYRLYDRPFNNAMLHALTKLFPKFISKLLTKYYIKKLQGLEAQIDIVFVINGQTLSKKFHDYVAAKWPKSTKILYMWDSFENRPNVRDSLKYYSKVFSFDRDACKRFGLNFRPLFFHGKTTDNFSMTRNTYLLSFIGTAHSDRYKILTKLYSQFQDAKVYKFLFLKAKWVYWLYRLFDKNYRQANLSEFHFYPISHAKYLEIISETEILVDIEHPNQSGLTIRNIEYLNSRKKFVTTNADVKNYEFFKSGNIEVIDRNDPKISQEFIERQFVDYDDETLKYYSIDGFVETCLC